MLFFFNTPALYPRQIPPFFDFCKICSAYGGPIIYIDTDGTMGVPEGRAFRISVERLARLLIRPYKQPNERRASYLSDPECAKRTRANF